MAYEWIVEALDETWGATAKILRARPDSDFARETACPGWDVKDVLSHLTGFEEFLRGADVPVLRAEAPSYVRNDVGMLNEAFVESYRTLSGAEVLGRFVRATQSSLEHLRGLDDAAWEAVGWSPEGERPLHRFMETRVLDSWIHLQDIRDALLEPADDHGPGEEVVVNRFEAAMPYVVGKRVAPPEGTVISFVLTGRLARRFDLVMREGRAVVAEPGARPDLVVTVPVALFWRRCAGRIGASAFLRASATEVSGNLSLAEALAEAMVVMI